jgi:hypothetical protein
MKSNMRMAIKALFEIVACFWAFLARGLGLVDAVFRFLGCFFGGSTISSNSTSPHSKGFTL